MRKIDDAHDAEDQGQAAGDEEQDRRLGERAQALRHDEAEEIHRAPWRRGLRHSSPPPLWQGDRTWIAEGSSPPPLWGRSIAAQLRCDRERGSLRITPTCSALSLRGYRLESARTKSILKENFCEG